MIQILTLAVALLLLSAGALWAQQRKEGSSRGDLATRLEALVDTPAPPVKMGAMCYDMVGPPDRVEYVCPTCSERTVYARDDNGFAVILAFSELESCRRLMPRLQQACPVDVAWDESAWCRHCSPDAKAPAAVLTFRYPQKEHRAALKSAEDLRILCEFFEGKLSHTTPTDGEVPLKQYAARLEELLGVDADLPDPGPAPVKPF